MKPNKLIVPLLFLTTLFGCAERTLELHGKMTAIEHKGEYCWIFVDDNHNSYEVITPSYQILKPGLQMRIRAVEVEKTTLCELPTVIDIVEFKPDFSKDM